MTTIFGRTYIDRRIELLAAGSTDEMVDEGYSDDAVLVSLDGEVKDKSGLKAYFREHIPALGGGSLTNDRIYLRGNRRDYDSWQQMGNEGWSYHDVLPYFKKSESYSGSENEYHGADGPLSVIDLPAPTPVSPAF